jgi:transforming growth factor-beta-induced protein
MSKITIRLLAILLLAGLMATTGVIAAVPAVQEGDDEPEALAATETVLDVIRSEESLESFLALVEAGALADDLDGEGPFTVLAPTNEAFEAFAAEQDQIDATLTHVLLYHVIEGNYPASTAAWRGSLPTLLGESVTFDFANRVNGSSVITTKNLEADNGVVHIIDEVLIPPPNSLFTSQKGSTAMNLFGVLSEDERFAAFLELAGTGGLDDLEELLSNPNVNYTVFVPSEEAIADMDEDLRQQLEDNPETDLQTIVMYHIVADLLGINQIVNDDFITTVEGRPLIVTTDEDLQVYINGYELSDYNIRASNGVIHIVEGVLTP